MIETWSKQELEVLKQMIAISLESANEHGSYELMSVSAGIATGLAASRLARMGDDEAAEHTGVELDFWTKLVQQALRMTGKGGMNA